MRSKVVPSFKKDSFRDVVNEDFLEKESILIKQRIRIKDGNNADKRHFDLENNKQKETSKDNKKNSYCHDSILTTRDNKINNSLNFDQNFNYKLTTLNFKCDQKEVKLKSEKRLIKIRLSECSSIRDFNRVRNNTFEEKRNEETSLKNTPIKYTIFKGKNTLIPNKTPKKYIINSSNSNTNSNLILSTIYTKQKEQVLTNFSHKNLFKKSKQKFIKLQKKTTSSSPVITQVNKNVFLSLNIPNFVKTKKENNLTNLENEENIHNLYNSIVSFERTKKDILIHKHRNEFSSKEMEEIHSYPEIYYYGLKDDDSKCTRKTQILDSAKSSNEETTFYYKLIGGDHLWYRYEIIELLGKGSFGQAVKCFDHKTREYVCVKIIKSDKPYTKQAKTEIKILDYIKKHDENNVANIIKHIDDFFFRDHVCIVFELLGSSLHQVLKLNYYQGLHSTFLHSVAFSILKSLTFLSKHRIIHTDIKPDNILLKKTGKYEIKLIDFGSSCFSNEKLYSYIQSRYYRSPEIILGLGYDVQIDMWSFGCLIVELYKGRPIFIGQNEHEQLFYFMEYLGIPPEYIIRSCKKNKKFFDINLQPIKLKNISRIPNSKKLEEFLENADNDFIDLVKVYLTL